MPSDINLEVKKGVKVNIVEVDDVGDGADASVTTEDDRKLKVHVKRIHGEQGKSSKVVDVIMCG